MEYTIGTPVLHSDICNNRRGWIAEAGKIESGLKISIIGANGLEEQTHRFTIVWENQTFSTDVNNGLLDKWTEDAHTACVVPITPERAAVMLADAMQAQADRFATQTAAREAKDQKISEWRDSIRDKIPAWAKAVIVGELVEDKSDTMTDYFASTTTKTIILGFSKHTRDLFPEMRKAARNHETTAFLADAPASAEHRQKYSMGGGYFLKDGHRHNSGWQVSKQTFYNRGNDIAQNIPFGEWAVAEPAPDAPRAATTDAGGFTIEEHTHTKRGFQMFIVSPKERVDRDSFTKLLADAKEAGGWYSRKWGTTPAGFAFKDQCTAEEFAALKVAA